MNKIITGERFFAPTVRIEEERYLDIFAIERKGYNEKTERDV